MDIGIIKAGVAHEYALQPAAGDVAPAVACELALSCGPSSARPLHLPCHPERVQ